MHDIFEDIEDICELKYSALRELANYGRKGEFSRNELPTIDMLAHTAKNLCKVIEMCEEKTGYSFGSGTSMRGGSSNRRGSSGNYSGEGSSYRGGSSGNYSGEGSSYRGGYSGARGRGRNASRDSMGRYSGDNDWLIETLNELREQSPDERMRGEFDEFISRMERMK